MSAALQVVIFPLPGLYGLAWVAVAPLIVAILRARAPETLQLDGQARLLPAAPWQGFVLGYVCGILWFAGTCYWVFDTMHRYGGMPIPAAALALILFCMYVGLYHGMFGLLLALVAGSDILGSNISGSKPAAWGASIRRALVAAPFLWVAVELARTRITAFPWELLGYSQTGNFALTRIATLTGVYGLSFEIVLVNSVFAAAFLVSEGAAEVAAGGGVCGGGDPAGGAVAGASAGRDGSHRAFGAAEYSDSDGRDVDEGIFSEHAAGLDRDQFASRWRTSGREQDVTTLIVWPESPSPFYTNDPLFRDAVSALAQAVGNVGGGGIDWNQRSDTAPVEAVSSQIFNSAALVNPQGEWVGRYDKVHLVPFGEYLPFPQLFAFAGGLTKEVGEFQRRCVARAPGCRRRAASECLSAMNRFFPMKCGRDRSRARRFW